MDKRGLTLLNIIIDIIIGVACVIILFMFVSTVFGLIFGKTTEDQAKASLRIFVAQLTSLSKDETKSFEPIYAPSGWYFVSFTKSESAGCWPGPCVCICESRGKGPLGAGGIFGATEQNCKSKSFCAKIDKPLVDSNKKDIEEKIPFNPIIYSNEFYELVIIKPYKLSNTELDKWLAQKYPEFKGLGQCINDESARTGVPVPVILAVAIHESAGGTSGLAKNCNNLFGVTATSERKGDAGVCNYVTGECLTEKEKAYYAGKGALVVSGEKKCTYDCSLVGKSCETVRRDFNAYSSKCKSINDFVNLISTSTNYKHCLQLKNEPSKMVICVYEGGGPNARYATDPKWALGVNDILAKNDQELSKIAVA